MNNILQIISFCIPSAMVAVVAYYFFYTYFKNEQSRRKYYIAKENSKILMPIRVQAYERITIFLDRISPKKILVTIQPVKDEKKEQYVYRLIKQIEDEFDHNITQQLYVSEQCWRMVKTAKDATIQILQRTSKLEEAKDIEKYREILLLEFLEKQSPSDYSTLYVVNEMKDLMI